ncbi:hypothetical protein D3C87_1574400 [compost metagenome]
MDARGADEAVVHDEQRARQARDRARQRERGQAQPEDRIAQRGHARLVVADAAQGLAEAAAKQVLQAREAGRGEGQHEPEEGGAVVQAQARADLRPKRQVVAIVAAVDAHGHCEVVQQLREGQRDHDEVHAARAQRHRAHQAGHQAGAHAAQSPQRPSRLHARLDEGGHRVGADADEAGVS